MITTNQTYLTECFQTGNEDVFCSQPPGVKETLYTILASEQNNQTYQLSYQLRMIGTALKSRRNGTTVAAKRQIKSSDCFLQCRKAIALQVAVYTVYPSVSPSLRYCVKMRGCREMRSSPQGSPVSLVFCSQEWLMGNDPVQVKFQCNPLRE